MQNRMFIALSAVKRAPLPATNKLTYRPARDTVKKETVFELISFSFHQ
jgi:hypothetical protein